MTNNSETDCMTVPCIPEAMGSAPVDRARTLALCQRVITLASCCDKTPWAAPVYYIYRHKGFWFFSSPDSRHVSQALDQPGKTGASVFSDAPSPDRIQGLQMIGTLSHDGITPKALDAAVVYAKQFSITIGRGTALSFIMNRFRAQFYCFRPETAVFMDNALGFGHRELVQL
ncbi:MAG: pyridoxamine 5'-phosphate oxidase family protein [Pseudomonadota bacterium]